MQETNTPDEDAIIKYMIATKLNELDDVTAFLHQYGNNAVDARAKGDTTALMIAAFNNHCALAQFFLEQGASIDAVDACNRTPLTFAKLRNDEEMICLLEGWQQAKADQLRLHMAQAAQERHEQETTAAQLKRVKENAPKIKFNMKK